MQRKWHHVIYYWLICKFSTHSFAMRSFSTPEITLRRLHIKRTRMNKDRGGGGQKPEISSEHTFWMTPYLIEIETNEDSKKVVVLIVPGKSYKIYKTWVTSKVFLCEFDFPEQFFFLYRRPPRLCFINKDQPLSIEAITHNMCIHLKKTSMRFKDLHLLTRSCRKVTCLGSYLQKNMNFFIKLPVYKQLALEM